MHKNKATTVLLLHGLGADNRMWSLVTRHMTGDFNPIALNLPGFGDENIIEPKKDDNLEGYTDWVADQIISRGIENSCVMGFSMGGTVALSLALRYPHLVGKLALICTSACWGEGRIPIFSWLQRKFILRIMFEFIQTGLLLKVKRVVKDEREIIALEDMLKSADINLMTKIYFDLMAADFRASLHNIKVPTVIVAGKKDFMAGQKHWESLKSGIPHAKLHLEREADHFLVLTHGERMAQIIMDFAKEKETTC